jgi:hypothetical protein
LKRSFHRTPAAPTIDLPLTDVVIEATERAPDYSADDVARAREAFASDPWLHPPAISRVDGRWILVAGFLRVASWRASDVDRGCFRRVAVGDVRELAITSLAEKLLLRDLDPHETVECVARLRESGMPTAAIAQYGRCSERWVRRLCSLRRRAHPDLWAEFATTATASRLTLRQMLRLAARPAEEQLRRLQEIRAAARVELHEDEARRDSEQLRTRFPRRREVADLLRIVRNDETLEAHYRDGACDVLRWLLYRVETRFLGSLIALRSSRGSVVTFAGAAVHGSDGTAQESADGTAESDAGRNRAPHPRTSDSASVIPRDGFR